jgi:hypothetical protein
VNIDGNNGITSLVPPPAGATLFGDTDDYLAFTTRSRGEPFVGKLGAGTVESQSAEVIYFLAQTGTEPIMDATAAPPTRLYTLYRRVLLIAPNASPVAVTDDVSQRAGAIPNTLGDLTKPENRFNHLPGAGGIFPFRMALPMVGFTLASGRLGDDVMMTNVLAFDVQVYDRDAPIFVTATTPSVALEPRDAGYAAQLTTYTIIASQPTGAYVDLGYFPNYNTLAHSFKDLSLFSGSPNAKSGIPFARTATNPYVYDTWSLHYENDGIQKQSAYGKDTGANGLDDNNNGMVDEAIIIDPSTGADTGEADTLPPYSAPLRGVRITVRVYEPSSQQVREIVVMQDFLPE